MLFQFPCYTMTLQQLSYIISLDKYRHFALAAEACGVTQPTLSSMIQKLEQELDIVIFDRGTHPIKPTQIGEKVIAQIKVALYHTQGIHEVVSCERQKLLGSVQMAIIPTVAPYIIPKFIHFATEKLPNLNIHITEHPTKMIIEQLLSTKIDIAIMTTPIEHPELLEIPLFYERFFAYISDKEREMQTLKTLSSATLSHANIWLLREGHCLRKQVLNICSKPSMKEINYDAGSIDTLIQIVDQNGGYTIIPELHIPSLTPTQQNNVRELVDPTVTREISFVVRKDFIKEQMLNKLAEVVRLIIPSEMLDTRLKKFAIRL